MDVNPLTPNKIQRLIHLAEDRSFNMPRRLLLNEEDLNRMAAQSTTQESAAANTNSSSGILDLEKVEGFGDSVLGNLSTAFNPGEMTGRSTGADEIKSKVVLSTTQTLDPYGRHSIALDSITNEMDKQTTEVHDILRHSIAADFSFHSKRDLTADESSFIKKEAPMPVPTNPLTNFAESIVSNSNTSVGAYFQNRCPDFGKILGKTDSPDRSYRPSITEVSSSSYQIDPVGHSTHYKMDQTLDSIPVKQPRNTETIPEKNIVNSLNNTKHLEKKTNIDPKKDIQNLFSSKLEKQDNTAVNKVQDKPKLAMSNNNVGQNSVMNLSSLPTDRLIKVLENSMKLTSDETGEECSLSISRIQDFLGRHSGGTNVSVTDIFKVPKKKQPLSELQMNMQGVRPSNIDHVALLKDTKNTATASSAGSVNTVISVEKIKAKEEKKELPSVILTEDTLNYNAVRSLDPEDVKEKPRSVRSRSPSSNSRSTLSTVQENFASFKSSESPLQSSRGEALIPSPNSEYKELDKSVNWHELLRHRHMKQSLAKDQWADISVTAAKGYVGVSCPVTITTTIRTDSWLTAKFQFDDPSDELTIELPRFPLLLSPGKPEQFTVHITSKVEMCKTLPFTMFLKDASIDLDIMQKGEISIDVKMPVIQAMSSDGVNKVTFPPIQEKTVLTKAFVLISDCEADLQLELSVVEGESLFSIKNVQEIKKSDVNKVLMDRQGSTEEPQKGKAKAMNKQLCRLTSGNAIRVTITFKAPKLSDIKLPDALTTFNGALIVNLYGLSTTLRKVDLIATVGSVNLVLQTGVPAGSKLDITTEPTKINLCNVGTIQGMWFIKFSITSPPGYHKIPFKVTPSKFDIRPGDSKSVTLAYTGPEDSVVEAVMAFEDVATGNKTKIEICSGSEKIKVFPVKTNHKVISWVRPGRKELSMKNMLDKKIHVKCFIKGEGFSIDLPGGETRGTYMVPFAPNETRPLAITFNPSSCLPHSATLHLVHDKNNEFSRVVRLYGCAGGDPLRWHGLVTYGDTALVRAALRQHVSLELYNKAAAPAFVCARVHFNLQFMVAESSSRLVGARRVVLPRSKHALQLQLDWPRVERRARDAPGSALATVTVLTGAELSRRRILRVLRNEAGEVDTSLLPEHLRGLADHYEAEDTNMDEQLALFNETKSSLDELLGGLHELTAQIDLPQDFADENTIIISDDTVIEHHTLLD